MPPQLCKRQQNRTTHHKHQSNANGIKRSKSMKIYTLGWNNRVTIKPKQNTPVLQEYKRCRHQEHIKRARKLIWTHESNRVFNKLFHGTQCRLETVLDKANQ
jgi:hypothetical protein